MRTAARLSKVGRQQTAMVKTYSGPIGGWNARDALASMAPIDAVVLNNWFPRASYVEGRGGSATHVTGMTGPSKTLMVYNALNGVQNQLFCATSNHLYDVSSPTGSPSAVLARTNAKHQWVMFGDGTNNWLIGVNGIDKPAYYDGTTWTAVTHLTSPALTGFPGDAVEHLIGVNVFKERLFFIPENSLSFWYLPPGVAGGALLEFNLASEAKKGGHLVAMGTWTKDSGAGVDDFAVFFTSEGEAMLYQGTNPSNANSWSKVGSYTIGKPLGRRCVIQYGGDCVVLTEAGTFPLQALLLAGDERARIALSYKIENAFVDAARSYGSTFGWTALTYAPHDALIVNVPLAEDGTHEQYVMNMLTKSWTRFLGWDAEDFAFFNGELYFCRGTSVVKAWTGTDDEGANLTFYGKQAFQDFGDPRQKHAQLFMPILATDGSIAYGADIDVDFEDTPMTGTATYSVSSGGVWDVSNWDESYWASGLEVVKQWSSPTQWQGRWLSTKVKVETNNLIVQWMASSLLYDHGQGI